MGILFKQICKYCFGWMADHTNLKDWKKCSSCGYAQNNKGDYMAISKDEILMGRIKESELSSEFKKNLDTLLERINKFRNIYGKAMIVNSGYRSPAVNASTPGASPTSWHMKCAAIDIKDEDGSLNKWCKEHEDVLKECELWCEERQGSWQHFQIYPPKSGKRWFNP